MLLILWPTIPFFLPFGTFFQYWNIGPYLKLTSLQFHHGVVDPTNKVQQGDPLGQIFFAITYSDLPNAGLDITR